MNELVRAAKTLTDPARVRVLNLLMQRECCVCEVMDVLDISQVNASRYCTALSDAGFLKMRREGRWKHYRVDYNACSPVLRDMLDSVKATAVADSVLASDIKRLGSASRRVVGCLVPSCVAVG